jgi:hypothetical protein
MSNTETPAPGRLRRFISPACAPELFCRAFGRVCGLLDQQGNPDAAGGGPGSDSPGQSEKL